ncbi:hypothetical protein DNTS_033871 [Danionella cerebrum]|uniref:PDZ domain-containing protein n=1 Tax=Danionella cerebrum TaxID=2873325 RepID=A0A553NGJ8_9TELE|nr:hypothetical protein DNTS_033871 [Danionella translucida]
MRQQQRFTGCELDISTWTTLTRSSMSSSFSVILMGPSPWGFRLQGGKDFSMPLTISRIKEPPPSSASPVLVGLNKGISSLKQTGMTLSTQTLKPEYSNHSRSEFSRNRPFRLDRKQFYNNAAFSIKDLCEPVPEPLTDGGKAAKAKIIVGDVLLSIDGIGTEGMTHLEAQNKIKACTGNLSLSLMRPSSKTETTKEEPLEIIKPVPISQTPAPPSITSSSTPSSLAPGSSAYNKTARPFGGGTNTVRPVSPSLSAPKASIPSASSAFTPAAPSGSANRSGSTPKSQPASGNTSSQSSSGSSSPARAPVPAPALPPAPHPSVYNTPIQLYSNENACEVAMGQRRGLMESKGEQQNGTGRKPTASEPELNHTPPPLSDASKKRLMEDTEDWHPRTGTGQSRSFRILAQITGTHNDEAQETRPGKKTTKVDPEQVRPQYNKLRDWHHGVCARLEKRKCLIGSKQRKDPRAESEKNDQMTSIAEVTSEPTEQLQSSSHATSSVKTMSKTSGQGNGIKHWQPPPAPNPTVSLAPPPERPAPQPHPEDQEDSLVQRAQHMPANTRTPMCAHCNTIIRGPFLVAMGKSWHKEEFVCWHCHGSLADTGFVEERGGVYCERCYEEYMAPVCTHCHQKILGEGKTLRLIFPDQVTESFNPIEAGLYLDEVINALKQTWHVNCFLCASCKQPIRNNTFHLEDGQPYCERDYYTLFGTGCHGCDFPIEAGDKFLEALGFTWHDTCFVCTVCSSSLEGQTFFSKKDKPLCKKHAHTVQF